MLARRCLLALSASAAFSMPALADCSDFSDVKRACTPAIVKGITQQDSDKAAERVEAVEETTTTCTDCALQVVKKVLTDTDREVRSTDR